MTLQLLISKLSEAGGGSRELDAEICAALRYVPQEPQMHLVGEIEAYGDSLVVWDKDINIRLGRYPAMPVSTSLDAALSLVEQKLPGAWWEVSSSGYALIEPDSAAPRTEIFEAYAATPALSVLIALLKAIEAQEDR